MITSLHFVIALLQLQQDNPLSSGARSQFVKALAHSDTTEVAESCNCFDLE